MRPFPFATTIAALVGIAAGIAIALYPNATRELHWALYGTVGLAVVIFIVSTVIHFRTNPESVAPAERTPTSVRSQTVSVDSSASILGDHNAGATVIGQVHIHHRPSLDHLPPIASPYAALKPDLSKAPFDMNMREAMRWKLDKLGRQATPDEMWDVFKEFREVAVQERLQVWGRPSAIAPVFGVFRPHERIPAKFWTAHEFDPTAYITGDDKDAIVAATSWDGVTRVPKLETFKYHDMRVSKENLEGIWGRLPTDDPKPEIEITLDSQAIHEYGTKDASGNTLPAAMAYFVNLNNSTGRLIRRCQLMFGLRMVKVLARPTHHHAASR